MSGTNLTGVSKKTDAGEVWTCLSLTQPFASAMFSGYKAVETRSWKTNYRGRLYIHAAKGMNAVFKQFAAHERFMHQRGLLELPRGVILGYVDLVDIKRTEDLVDSLSPLEKLYGDYRYGRFGWVTENPVLLLEPIPACGKLSLWKFAPSGGEGM